MSASTGPVTESSSDAVERLRRGRPRNHFLRGVTWTLVGLAAWAWLGGTVRVGDLFSGSRADNLLRFVTVELVPQEVRHAAIPEGAGALEAAGIRTGAFFGWVADRFSGSEIGQRNLNAAAATLAVAVVAAVLAALFALLLAPFTARTVFGARVPFVTHQPSQGGSSVARGQSIVGRGARFLCVLMRSIPEYILAFLLGAALPDPAWACVLALAIHNGGILGRLFGETLENLDQRPGRAWHAAGAPRVTTYLGAQFPEGLPRMLTYFFTRFESCVRESTVLGMLGFVSLGHWIVQERAAGRYDEMIMLVALGSIIVIAADFVSWIARTIVRRGS